MNAPIESLANKPDEQLQCWPDGSLRHLLTLQNLSANTIVTLLDKAEQFLSPGGSFPKRSDALHGHTVANLFFEPSTRTRASFELAAKRLSADVLNLDVNTSSRIKGESILDTIYTLQAMQCDVFVVRDAGKGIPAYIAENVDEHICILNAGEADRSHPTQGLLDAMTIRQHKPDLQQTKVAIVGDIAHSRVARSAYFALVALGVKDIRLIAPPELAPDAGDYPEACLHQTLASGLEGADVVMALRIQRERIQTQAGQPSAEQYHAEFGITKERLRLLADRAIVMHPGPMNRGVEISAEVADGPQSVIQQQVTNGLAVRMAVLSHIIENRRSQL